MKIDITDDDIAKGLPGMCGQCPTSRAMMRQIPGKAIRVFNDHVTIDDEVVSLPESLRNWMHDFDMGLPVAAGDFVIAWGERPWIDFPDQVIQNMNRDPVVVEVFELDYETVVADLMARKELACQGSSS